MQQLGLFSKGEFPVSVGLLDLDYVTRAIDRPDVLLGYLRARAQFQLEGVELLTDEVELVGAYLSTRLRAQRFWGQGRPKPGLAVIDGYQEELEKANKERNGSSSNPAGSPLRVPDEIRAILDGLRSRRDDNSVVVSQWLLDAPDVVLYAIAKGARELYDNAVRQSSPIRRISGVVEGISITLCTTWNDPPSSFSTHVWGKTALEKYRSRAPVGLGLGLRFGGALDEALEVAVLLESPWKEDAAVESALQKEAPLLVSPLPGAKLPGRNDPCFCGSGKKFKHCHLPMMARR